MRNFASIKMDWEGLKKYLNQLMGKPPRDLKSVLYLVGVQELGKGFRPFSKEEKQDLIHIGTCSLLAQRGYYVFRGRDEEGWPHYELQKGLPFVELAEQEGLIKDLAIEYFQKIKHEGNNI